MSFGRVVPNAGSHRILHVLSSGPCDTKTLKNIVGAINSVPRFESEYMGRLVENGFAQRKQGKWVITEAGQEKLEELGPARGVYRANKTETKHGAIMSREVYDPSKEIRTPMRPGSEEFLKYPSRIGNKLYYRDGTVKEVKDGY